MPPQLLHVLEWREPLPRGAGAAGGDDGAGGGWGGRGGSDSGPVEVHGPASTPEGNKGKVKFVFPLLN